MICLRRSSWQLPRWFAVGVSAACTLALLAGCGPSRPVTVPVRGVVTLDGKPVNGATVLFQPTQGVPGRAITAADGSFELTTFAKGDGAVVGRHSVAVSKFTMSGVAETEGGVSGPVAAGGAKETWVTPQKYATAAESGLEVEVKPGLGAVSLELKSN
jgi:hypothetical protein